MAGIPVMDDNNRRRNGLDQDGQFLRALAFAPFAQA